MSDESQLYDIFVEESTEQIEQIEDGILKIEKDPEDMETIKEIFRMAHSLKGSAATIGFANLSDFTHSMENLLDKVKNNVLPANEEVVALLLECLDKIKEIHTKIAEERSDESDTAELKDKIFEMIGKKPIERKVNKDALDDFNVTEYELLVMDDGVKKGRNVYVIKVYIEEGAGMRAMKAFLIINNLKEVGQVVRVWPDNYEDANDETFGNSFKFVIITSDSQDEVNKMIDSVGEIERIVIEPFEGKESESKTDIDVRVSNTLKDNQAFRNEKRTTVRVDISKLDKLIGLVGEFVIDKERLLQITDRLRLKYKGDKDIQELLVTMPHVDFIGTEIQESIMAVRMYTLEGVFSRFPRMVRDLAIRNAKEVEFMTEGEDTELDRSLIEEIVDPLVHLIRNAVDHGIETTEERIAKGKTPKGKVILRARQEENNVVIEVVDDGKGLDIDAIKLKAVEKGLATIEEIGQMPENKIYDFIFMSGFSTAKLITDVSGRGVGMDVVRTNIEKLNGMIEIQTEKDKGSIFTIKLPLTLAIIQALLIKEAEIQFAIPLSSVIETVRLTKNEIKEQIKKVKGKEVYIWREQVLPVIRIKDYFDIKNENTDNEKMFLIVAGFSERRICFAVEGLLGEQQIVIKSLGEYLGKGKIFGEIKGISGATILGDGSFAYIIDIPGIVKDNKHQK